MKARFRDEDLADAWVMESNRWIEANKGRPFFLFFASQDIHVPRIAHERFQGKTSLGPRGDCIVQLDWCVGELMKTLDRLQLADNTLVVFCSDNGPVLDDGYKDDAVEKLGEHQPAGPYRGGKYSVWEGGTRTPFITRWKGRIEPGVSEEMVCTIDFASSIAAITGQSVAPEGCLDSLDVSAIRHGDWKLIEFFETGACELYDLRRDLGEQHDLAATQPDRVQSMQIALSDWRKQVAAQMPEPNPKYDPQRATDLGKNHNGKRMRASE